MNNKIEIELFSFEENPIVEDGPYFVTDGHFSTVLDWKENGFFVGNRIFKWEILKITHWAKIPEIKL